MLIQALCAYAEKQKTSASPEGWQEQEIHFRILLTPEGEIAGIVDVRQEVVYKDNKGKEKSKRIPRTVMLPIRTQKSGIESNYIEHRPLYIFGLNYESNAFTPEDRTNKAQKSNAAFVERNLAFFEGLDSKVCVAYRRFLETWNPQNGTQHPALLQLGKEYKGSYFGFGMEGLTDFLEEDTQFRERYQQFFCASQEEHAKDEQCAVCGILGESLPMARIHNKIRFPGGNPTGCVLVGMKETAFESYGKTQSYNSNVSEKAMKQYTDVMNHLLSDRNHYKMIGDMVILYFAMKSDDAEECAWFGSQFGMPVIPEDEETAKQEEVKQADAELNKLFTQTTRGAVNLLKDEDLSDVTFYVVGMTPNSSRICQKFIWRDSFQGIKEAFEQHQRDLHINPRSRRSICFSSIAKELVHPKSNDKKPPPPLMTAIILSAMKGTAYPDAMLSTVIQRIKTDSDEEKNHFIKLNDTRAGIIKACLNRKARLRGEKEEITMAWDETCQNPAYLCGGLFAIYEKIQKDASGDLNRTIKDSYFASACSRPASIMPKLDKLSQNHMRKLSDGSRIYYQKEIARIMGGLSSEGFPQTLSMDAQGRFIIGYYQMNQKMYTTKNDEKEG